MKTKYQDHFYKTLFAIAAPIVVQNIIGNLVNLIDVFMISSLSDASISGVGLANKVFFLFNLFLFGTNSGASILASQYWGNEDVKNIRKVLGVTLLLGMSGAVFFSGAAILAPEGIMRIFAPDEAEVIAEGAGYLRIVGISYLFTAITFAFSFILRTTHHTKLPMFVSGSAIIVNAFFNWVLIFGKLGAPEMGVKGAAIATVLARVLECVILIGLVYRYQLPLAGKLKEFFGFSAAFFNHFMKTVIFVILNEVVWSLGVTGYSLVYGRMGEVVTASITITQTIEQLSFVVIFGLCNACGVMLGNALGSDQLDVAKSYGKRFLRLTMMLAIGFAGVMYLSAGFIASVFNVSDAVRENIILCIRVYCLLTPFKALNMVIIVGILRSGGDTFACLMFDLLGVWFIGLPMGILGGLVFKLPVQYVYGMIMLEEPAKLIMAYWRYRSGRWIKNIILDTPE